MLTLSVKDSNSEVVVVATAIAEKEDAQSYTFLLSKCLESEEFAGYLNSESMTVFTDGHEGSTAALAACMPKAQRRLCVKHLMANSPPIDPVRLRVEIDI